MNPFHDSQLLIKTGYQHIAVKLNEIIKCEADGNHTYFYLDNNKKYLASNTLKYYEGLLSSKGFFKAHRSILVNINYIVSIYKKETLVLKNNDKVHVSVRNKSNLSKLIDLLS